MAKGSSEQVKAWRDEKRESYGGMSNMSVWVRKDQRDDLRFIFDALADPELGSLHRRDMDAWNALGKRLEKIGYIGTSAVDNKSAT
tara:strand:+ start:2291 stop:2548 length:258 start_codon:yes stop_codon:yes gene_type:complete